MTVSPSLSDRFAPGKSGSQTPQTVSATATRTWILAAIDGTGSREWNPNGAGGSSSVARFFQDLKTPSPLKKYLHGPSDGVTGRDMLETLTATHEWLRGLCSSTPDSCIVLVGHSRGGAGCVELARRLQQDSVTIHFMGLYDAVDRTMSSEVAAEAVPDNVATLYHAMRDPKVGSRTSFGNCAKQVSPRTTYEWKYFWGTHGAVGGSPETDGTTQSKLFGASRTSYTSLTPQQEAAAVMEADLFVRNGARAAGVPI